VAPNTYQHQTSDHRGGPAPPGPRHHCVAGQADRLGRRWHVRQGAAPDRILPQEASFYTRCGPAPRRSSCPRAGPVWSRTPPVLRSAAAG